MGLSRRLAALAALLAILLVLGANGLATTWSARSRLEDYRLETVELAHTLADYLANLEPRGKPQTLAAGVAGWSRERIEVAEARVFLRSSSELALAGASASDAGSAPTTAAKTALADGNTHTEYETGLRPGWLAAVPFRTGGEPAVVEVFVSTERLNEWEREERRRSYGFALGTAVLLAGGVFAFTELGVGQPLRALSEAMDAGSKGPGAGAAPAAAEIGPQEFRAVARSYNALTKALGEREAESAARAELLSLAERARGFERAALVEQTANEFAHEIGTPLHTMSGHLQLLRDDLSALAGAGNGLPAGARDRVDLVLSQLDRVAGVVRRGVDGGSWPPARRESVDLADVAHRLAHFLEPSLAEAGVTVRVSGTNAHARGDIAFVEHIALNLMKNALEVSPRGGTIDVRVAADARRATLEVADDGPGLATEARARLFEPYVTTKGVAGRGLGLTVSRRLAEAQSSTLELVPTSHGACWRLTLPAAHVA